MTGRKTDIDDEVKHGFGDYLQGRNDAIDNYTKPITAGAIELITIIIS